MGNKRIALVAVALLALAVPTFVNSLGNPRLAGLRGPDVMQLIAIGSCALGLAFGMLTGGRTSS